jgi:hypothetical protein
MHCLRLNHLSSRQKAKKVAKRQKKEENPFKGIKKEKEDPQMNDSMFLQDVETEREAMRPGMIEMLTRYVEEYQVQERKKQKPGRPQEVPWKQLQLGMLVSILFGMSNYQQLWRQLSKKPLGEYARISVQDDAIIKRLRNAGSAPFEHLLKQVGGSASVEATGGDLATFAPKIVAIDEMTGDQMRRQLKAQRSLKKGDTALLPGKLAGRFNIRSQQWEEVQWREDVQANCKVNMGSLLQGLEAGSLVLFDLGYFAFWWFDELSERGYRWVSRLREKTSYRIVHEYWRFEGNLDALIWLGAYRADRAGRMVRLVRFWDGEKLHSYITNVLDPRQLPLKEIAQLYGRRWDIELAFLLIKQYLGLHHWWSSQPELIQQQCFAVLIVAQVIQGMRMQMAREAGVDAFEVSLPLLLEVLPDLLREQQEPVEWITTYGRELGIIRASTRFSLSVPEVVESDLVMPMQELPRERKERYHSYGEEGGKEGKNVTKSKTGGQKRNEARKKEKGKKEEGKREGKEKKEKEEKKEEGKEGKKEGVLVKKKSLGQENRRGGKEEKIKQEVGGGKWEEGEEKTVFGEKEEKGKIRKGKKENSEMKEKGKRDRIDTKGGLPEFSG